MTASAAFLLQGSVLAQTTVEQLGEALYFDQNLSINSNQSCASCHDPLTGFVDPDTNLPTSEGSIAGLFGGLNAPSAAYAAFSPFFRWDEVNGLFVGGQFWNGRANTLAEQAAGPFLNPVEMAMPDKWAVVERIKASGAADYRAMFMDVYKINLDNIATYPTAIDVNTVAVDEVDFPPGVLEAYDRMAKAIGEFEKTPLFTKFDSKYDYYLAGMTTLTKQEEKGLKLFEGQGMCALCHLSAPSIAPDTVSALPPLFTDFTYDNLGVPQNVNIPGMPIDPGLGGNPYIVANDDGTGNLINPQMGKHKVMTLRNIELTPPYAHNGVFTTLAQIVHFYNTRDVLGVCVDNNDPGFGTTCWPVPEILQNVNTAELGNLHLTADQEADIVAFLLTLTDGWGTANGMPALPRPPMPPMP